MDGFPSDGVYDNDHLGTFDAARGAVHPITVSRKPRFKSTQDLVLTALGVRIHQGVGEIALSLAGGRAAADR
jgi:hypothetical protein